jgi:AAA family ATP:ADP antiporter
LIRALIRRLVAVRDDELASMLWAFAYFFALMFGYYLLRAVREAMGIERGWEQLPWFFLGTFCAMAVAVPIYFWLVSRIPRRRIVPIVLHFGVVCLLAFWALLHFQIVPRARLAPVFFVWISVFNVFAISVFWSLMADLFKREQGKRLFGFVSAGGSAGGLLGPLAAQYVTPHIGQAQLLPISALFFEIAVLCISQLPRSEGREIAGGGLWSGFQRVIHSPYLLGIAGQTLCTTTTATFIYFQQAQIVQATAHNANTRTSAFAGIDLWVNLATLGVQVIGTGRILERLGLAVGFSITPIVNALGSLALAFSPRLAVLTVVQAARRASHYALERPTREVLFTVVPTEDKYKAKNFLDTFVYRGGDVGSAFAVRGLAALGLAIRGTALVAIPISAVWLVLVLFLARRANVARHEEAGVPPGSSGEPAASA